MKIELNQNKVYFNNGSVKKEIHPFWLRERVDGEEFLDKGTQQRLFDPTTLSSEISINTATINKQFLEIDFNEKGLEGRFGSNEESTRQLLQDTLPKLRIALRDILEENQGLKFDVGDNESSNRDSNREREASNGIAEELNFESEVLVGRTMDSELGSMVGLDILV